MKLIIYWPIVIIVTVILYLSILVFLPFDEVKATIMLFTLVAFWSRLPGVGHPSPFHVLYLADFVDFFTVIIAVNISGVYGVFFVIFGNMVSRMCGVYPSWLGVIKDTIAMGIASLLIPFVHELTGKDIFISIILFSIIRWLMFFPMRFLPTETSFPQFLIEMFGAGALIIVINGIYARLFGNFFNNILQQGVQFSWILFLFVTVVIVGSYMYMRRISGSNAAAPISAAISLLFRKKKHASVVKRSELQKIYK